MYENKTNQICAHMEKFTTYINGDLDNMSESEQMYAEALAHLLERDTKDYIDFLEEADEDVSFNIAAEPGASYGEE